MTAKVIQFPIKEKVIGYKIPLYTDEEIFVTVSAMNMYSDSNRGFLRANKIYIKGIILTVILKFKWPKSKFFT